jgi:hypothetical protein
VKKRRYVDPDQVVYDVGRTVKVKLGPGRWAKLLITHVDIVRDPYTSVSVRGEVVQ